MKLRIPPPPSANRMYYKGRVKTQEYRNWMAAAVSAIPWCMRVTGPVKVSFSMPKNGRRDLDNYAKPLVDVLTVKSGAGVIEDDRWRTVKEIHMRWHENHDDVEVEVTEWQQEP